MPLEDWFDRLGGLTHVHGNVHRSPLPFTRPHFEQLRKGGIEVIYSMEHAIPGQLARDMGFDWRPHFWTDDEPPTPAQMGAFLDDLRAVGDESPVVVHCKAGWGRTGSAITCALVDRLGWSAEQALRHYWTRVPPAENVMRANGQEAFVRGYAAARSGRGLYVP
jgi:protein-tyrosine phosphatase